MTREQYAKSKWPEVSWLFAATIRDYHAGISIKTNVSANDFNDGLEWWFRKFLAKAYNELVRKLRSGGDREFTNDLGIRELAPRSGQVAYLDIQSAKDAAAKFEKDIEPFK